MADKKITDLTAAAAVTALTDLVECVQAAATVPVSRKLTYQQLFNAYSILAADTPTLASIIPGAATGTAKAYTPQKILNLFASLAAQTPQLGDPVPFSSAGVASRTTFQGALDLIGSLTGVGSPELTHILPLYDTTNTVTGSIHLQGLWNTAGLLTTIGPPLEGDELFVFFNDDGSITQTITYFDLLSSIEAMDTAAPMELTDKMLVIDGSDSNAPKQATIQELWDNIILLNTGSTPDPEDSILFYDDGQTRSERVTFEEFWAGIDNLDDLDPVSSGDSLVASDGGGTGKKLSLGDLATFVGNSTNNIWSSSGNLIRRVIYTTGATSVPMGETASSSGTGSVSAKAVSATNPAGANFTTGGTSTNIFGWNSTAHHITAVNATYEYLIAWPDTTSVRYLCGLGSNSAVNMAASGDTPGTAFHVAMLRWSTNASDTDLVFLTGNASAQTVTTLTGVSKPAGTFRLKIVVRGAGTAIDVYINNVIAATGITGTLPTTTQTMQMTGSVVTLTNATRVANLYEEACSEQY